LEELLKIVKKSYQQRKDKIMQILQWALIAFVVAVVAAIIGFGGITKGAASVAKFLFGLFLVVAVVLLIIGIL